MYQQQPPVKIVVAFDDIAGHKGCKSATNSERQYYYVLSTSPTSAVAEAVNTASRVVNINMKARARELPNFTPPSSKSTRTTASARFKSVFGRRPPCTFSSRARPQRSQSWPTAVRGTTTRRRWSLPQQQQSSVCSVCFFIQKQLNSLPPWKKWPQNKYQYLKIQCFKKYEKK